MKKLGLAALMTLPLLGGCYAYVPGGPYYGHRHYYRPVSRVYVSPAPVYAAPRPVVVTPPRVYW